MKIVLKEGAKCPTRAHKTDAGLDIYARETVTISPKTSYVFDTGIHVELPEGTVGLLKSKSGLYMKHSITSEGVVDEGYTGAIKVKLINHSDLPYQVLAGDKITQLVIVRCEKPELEIVNELTTSTTRGNNGFGSTGR